MKETMVPSEYVTIIESSDKTVNTGNLVPGNGGVTFTDSNPVITIVFNNDVNALVHTVEIPTTTTTNAEVIKVTLYDSYNNIIQIVTSENGVPSINNFQQETGVAKITLEVVKTTDDQPPRDVVVSVIACTITVEPPTTTTTEGTTISTTEGTTVVTGTTTVGTTTTPATTTTVGTTTTPTTTTTVFTTVPTTAITTSPVCPMKETMVPSEYVTIIESSDKTVNTGNLVPGNGGVTFTDSNPVITIVFNNDVNALVHTVEIPTTTTTNAEVIKVTLYDSYNNIIQIVTSENGVPSINNFQQETGVAKITLEVVKTTDDQPPRDVVVSVIACTITVEPPTTTTTEGTTISTTEGTTVVTGTTTVGTTTTPATTTTVGTTTTPTTTTTVFTTVPTTAITTSPVCPMKETMVPSEYVTIIESSDKTVNTGNLVPGNGGVTFTDSNPVITIVFNNDVNALVHTVEIPTTTTTNAEVIKVTLYDSYNNIIQIVTSENGVPSINNFQQETGVAKITLEVVKTTDDQPPRDVVVSVIACTITVEPPTTTTTEGTTISTTEGTTVVTGTTTVGTTTTPATTTTVGTTTTPTTTTTVFTTVPTTAITTSPVCPMKETMVPSEYVTIIESSDKTVNTGNLVPGNGGVTFTDSNPVITIVFNNDVNALVHTVEIPTTTTTNAEVIKVTLYDSYNNIIQIVTSENGVPSINNFQQETGVAKITLEVVKTTDDQPPRDVVVSVIACTITVEPPTTTTTEGTTISTTEGTTVVTGTTTVGTTTTPATTTTVGTTTTPTTTTTVFTTVPTTAITTSPVCPMKETMVPSEYVTIIESSDKTVNTGNLVPGNGGVTFTDSNPVITIVFNNDVNALVHTVEIPTTTTTNAEVIKVTLYDSYNNIIQIVTSENGVPSINNFQQETGVAKITLEVVKTTDDQPPRDVVVSVIACTITVEPPTTTTTEGTTISTTEGTTVVTGTTTVGTTTTPATTTTVGTTTTPTTTTTVFTTVPTTAITTSPVCPMKETMVPSEYVTIIESSDKTVNTGNLVPGNGGVTFTDSNPVITIVFNNDVNALVHTVEIPTTTTTNAEVIKVTLYDSYNNIIQIVTSENGVPSINNFQQETGVAKITLEVVKTTDDQPPRDVVVSVIACTITVEPPTTTTTEGTTISTTEGTTVVTGTTTVGTTTTPATTTTVGTTTTPTTTTTVFTTVPTTAITTSPVCPMKETMVPSEYVTIIESSDKTVNTGNLVPGNGGVTFTDSNPVITIVFNNDVNALVHTVEIPTTTTTNAEVIKVTLYDSYNNIIQIVTSENGVPSINNFQQETGVAKITLEVVKTTDDQPPRDVVVSVIACTITVEPPTTTTTEGTTISTTEGTTVVTGTTTVGTTTTPATTTTVGTTTTPTTTTTVFTTVPTTAITTSPVCPMKETMVPSEYVTIIESSDKTVNTGNLVPGNGGVTFTDSNPVITIVFNNDVNALVHTVEIPTTTTTNAEVIKVTLYDSYNNIIQIVTSENGVPSINNFQQETGVAKITLEVVKTTDDQPPRDVVVSVIACTITVEPPTTTTTEGTTISTTEGTTVVTGTTTVGTTTTPATTTTVGTTTTPTTTTTVFTTVPTTAITTSPVCPMKETMVPSEYVTIIESSDKTVNTGNLVPGNGGVTFTDSNPVITIVFNNDVNALVHTVEIPTTTTTNAEVIKVTLYDSYNNIIQIVTSENGVPSINNFQQETGVAKITLEVVKTTDDQPPRDVVVSVIACTITVEPPTTTTTEGTTISTTEGTTVVTGTTTVGTTTTPATTTTVGTTTTPTTTTTVFTTVPTTAITTSPVCPMKETMVPSEYVTIIESSDKTVNTGNLVPGNGGVTFTDSNPVITIVFNNDVNALVHTVEIPTTTTTNAEVIKVTLYDSYNNIIQIVTSENGVPSINNFQQETGVAKITLEVVKTTDDQPPRDVVVSVIACTITVEPPTTTTTEGTTISTTEGTTVVTGTTTVGTTTTPATTTTVGTTTTPTTTTTVFTTVPTTAITTSPVCPMKETMVPSEYVTIIESSDKTVNTGNLVPGNGGVTFTDSNPVITIVFNNDVNALVHTVEIPTTTTTNAEVIKVTLYDSYNNIIQIVTSENGVPSINNFQQETGVAKITLEVVKTTDDQPPRDVVVSVIACTITVEPPTTTTTEGTTISTTEGTTVVTGTTTVGTTTTPATTTTVGTTTTPTTTTTVFTTVPTTAITTSPVCPMKETMVPSEYVTIIESSDKTVNTGNLVPGNGGVTFTDSNPVITIVFNNDVNALVHTVEIPTTTTTNAEVIKVTLYDSYNNIIQIVTSENGVPSINNFQQETGVAKITLEVVKTTDDQPPRDVVVSVIACTITVEPPTTTTTEGTTISTTEGTTVVTGTTTVGTTTTPATTTTVGTTTTPTTTTTVFTTVPTTAITTSPVCPMKETMVPSEYVTIIESSDKTVNTGNLVPGNGGVTFTDSNPVITIVFNNDVNALVHTVEIPTTTTTNAEVIKVTLYDSYNNIIQIVTSENGVPSINNFQQETGVAKITLEVVKTTDDQPPRDVVVSVIACTITVEPPTTTTTEGTTISTTEGTTVVTGTTTVGTTTTPATTTTVGTTTTPTTTTTVFTTVPTTAITTSPVCPMKETMVPSEYVTIIESSDKTVNTGNLVPGNGGVTFTDSNPVITIVFNNDVNALVHTVEIPTTTTTNAEVIKVTLYDSYNNIIQIVTSENGVPSINNFQQETGVAKITLEVVKTTDDQPPRDVVVSVIACTITVEPPTTTTTEGTTISTTEGTTVVTGTTTVGTTTTPATTTTVGTTTTPTTTTTVFTTVPTTAITTSPVCPMKETMVPSEYVTIIESSDKTVNTGNLVPGNGGVTFTDSNPVITIVFNNDVNALVHTVEIPTTTTTNAEVIKVTLYDSYNNIIQIVTSENGVPSINNFQQETGVAKITLEVVKTTDDQPPRDVVVSVIACTITVEPPTTTTTEGTTISTTEGTTVVTGTTTVGTTTTPATTTTVGTTTTPTTTTTVLTTVPSTIFSTTAYG